MRPELVEVRYTADWSGRVIWGVLIGVLVAMTAYAYVTNPRAIQGLVAAIVFWLLPQVYLSSFLISISAEGIEYRQLYFQRREMKWSEIARAGFSVKFLGSDPMTPPIGLTLVPTPESGQRPLVINAKVFSREALARVVQCVAEHGGEVEGS